MGFEPTTLCLGSKCSTPELRPPSAPILESACPIVNAGRRTQANLYGLTLVTATYTAKARASNPKRSLTRNCPKTEKNMKLTNTQTAAMA